MLQLYHNFLLLDFDIHICYSWDFQETFATLQISNKIKAYIDILVQMVPILIFELVTNVSIFVTGAIGIDIGMPISFHTSLLKSVFLAQILFLGNCIIFEVAFPLHLYHLLSTALKGSLQLPLQCIKMCFWYVLDPYILGVHMNFKMLKANGCWENDTYATLGLKTWKKCI